jgi:uncharacterized protein
MNFIARLMPREGRFFTLFDGHAKLIVDGAIALADVLRHYEDEKGRDAGIKRIEDAEHAADRITHETVQLLHTTFVTPFDRDDIHRLISRMDDVLDLIDASAERIWLYGIRTMEPDARELARVLEQAVIEMGEAVRRLRDLKDRPRLLAHCTEINRLENVGDQLLRRAMARLFTGGSDAIHVVKWKEIYDYLENAIDRCEDVANVIEGVALEYS